MTPDMLGNDVLEFEKNVYSESAPKESSLKRKRNSITNAFSPPSRRSSFRDSGYDFADVVSVAYNKENKDHGEMRGRMMGGKLLK